RIKFGKRVLSIRQNIGEVIVQCADKSVHHADILVGADGAYSAVRQCLHTELETKGLLPKTDSMPMGYQYDCLVGVTDPMDPHQISALFDKFSEFQTVLSRDSTFSQWCIPLTGNRVSWMVVKFHDRGKKYAEEQIFKQSDWGEDAAEVMSYEYRQCKTPYGCELGYLMDRTPKGCMAKVMLEEKSILDMVALANLLVDLKSNTASEIECMFEVYFKQRGASGRSSVLMSSRLGGIMNRKSWVNDLIRKAVLRHTPRWLAVLTFFICKREVPSVAAMIYPFGGAHVQKFYWGTKETLLPVYTTL
ncbi:citrate synthase, partial [Mortierella sp. GBA30]